MSKDKWDHFMPVSASMVKWSDGDTQDTAHNSFR